MIKTAFQNYFKNFKWFFYVLGITGAGLLIFFGILMLGILLPIKSSDINVYNNVTSYITNYFTTLRLTDIMTADFLKVFIKGLGDSAKDLKFFLKVIVLIELGLSALIVMGSVQLAQFLTRRAMRKTVKTQYTKKGVRAMVVKQIVSIGFSVLYAFLTYVWFFAVFLLPLLSLVLNSVQSLYLTWYIHYREFEKKKIFNAKNALMLAGSSILLLYFNFAVVILVSFINIIAAAAFAVPLFTYNARINEITARGYFKTLVEGGELVSTKPPKKKKGEKMKELLAPKNDEGDDGTEYKNVNNVNNVGFAEEKIESKNTKATKNSKTLLPADTKPEKETAQPQATATSTVDKPAKEKTSKSEKAEKVEKSEPTTKPAQKENKLSAAAQKIKADGRTAAEKMKAQIKKASTSDKKDSINEKNEKADKKKK